MNESAEALAPGVLEALEAAQQRMAAGTPRAEALAAVPGDQRAEVDALLDVIARVESIAEAPSAAFRATLDAGLRTAVDAARVAHHVPASRRGLFSLGVMRFAAVAAAVVLALGWGGFAAVQAADPAIPGDALYSVKEAGESVRIFFARGDGVTKARLAQLAKRQAELEQAVGRGSPPRVVARLEVKVAISTNELVRAVQRLAAGGNPAPAQASIAAVTLLDDRIDALAATESRPEVARLLRRMSVFLEGKERELQSISAGRPSTSLRPAAPSEAPGRTAR